MGLLSSCAAAVVAFVLVFNAVASAEQPASASPPSAGEHKEVELVIPPQSLPRALKAVGDAFNLNVLFGDDVGSEVLSGKLRGTYTVAEALKRLLKNTGLEFRQVDATTVTVRRSARLEGAGPKRVSAVNRSVSREHSDIEDAYVVVTGSRLHHFDAADASPERVYDQDALEQSGAATLAEFSQLLPENFNSVSPISSLFGNTVGTSQLGNNLFLGSGFNLAGLGPEATLTLLDGDRLVSSGASGTFFDLSMLPMNAVEGIVTLTGDTSAVYGSDAIAGVVNILLRPGTDANETRVRYGTTSDGGGGRWIFSQRLGGSWPGGDGMIAYQRAQQNAILSSARDYIPAASPVIDIVPRQSSSGLLGKLEHDFTQGTAVKVHFLYAARDVTDDSSGFSYVLARDSPVQEYGGTVHIDHRLTPEWTIGLYGSYSTLEQYLTSSAPGLPSQGQPGGSSLGELALSANAEPITLNGRPVRLAFGAGGRKETLTVPTSVYHRSYTSLAEKVGDLYLETLVPLASGSHRLLQRLELSLVAREDYYQVVGPTFNPKAGLVWSPLSDLTFRATFARSFRPPTLDQLAAIPLYYTVNVPDPISYTGFTDTLVNQSQGRFRLKPEIARTLTSGLDYCRDCSGGWGGSVTWFRTVFDNRIAAPLAGFAGPTIDIFSQPALAPYITRQIPPNEVQAIFANPGFVADLAGAGAGGVGATFDNELTNIARTFEEGLETSLRYSSDDRPRQFSAFATANYLLRDTYRLIPGAATFSVLNNIGQPPGLRARGGVTGSWNDWRASLNVNYTGRYRNTLVSPAQAVSSWTTLDCQLAWQLPVSWAPDLRLTFNSRNILNAAPPRIQGPPFRPVSFDAANASPFGRTLSMEISVGW